MQLDQSQMRAFLYRANAAIFHFGEAAPPGWKYVGDLFRHRVREVEEYATRSHSIFYVCETVSELTGFPLGTELDERTAEAFAVAKANVENGRPINLAWPQWYIQNLRSPREIIAG